MRGVSVAGDENLHGIVQDVYRRYLQIHKYRVVVGAAATLKVYSPLVIKHPKSHRTDPQRAYHGVSCQQYLVTLTCLRGQWRLQRICTTRNGRHSICPAAVNLTPIRVT